MNSLCCLISSFERDLPAVLHVQSHADQLLLDLIIDIQPFLVWFEGLQVVKLRERFAQVWLGKCVFIFLQACQDQLGDFGAGFT